MKNKKLGKALTSHAALAVSGVTAVTALALHSASALLVGGVAVAALVAWEARATRPSAQLRPCPLGRADAYQDPSTRAAVTALRAAHGALERTLDEGPEELPLELAHAFDALAELESHAASLARRAEEIARHFAKVDAVTLRRDAAELAARAGHAADEETRAHYEAARASRVAHLDALSDLMRSKERIGAVLLSIAATLEAMPARVLQARGLGAGADVARQVRLELENVTTEIASMEDALITLEGT